MAQELIPINLCDIDLPERVEGKTRYEVIDGKLMAMEICHDHRLTMNDVDREEIFKRYAREVQSVELGNRPSIPRLPGSPENKSPRDRSKKGKGHAICPVCGKNNLEGEATDVSSRGILQHIRQTKDNEHQRVYDFHNKYKMWPAGLPHIG